MNQNLLPREWMVPAKRPPTNYLLPWQILMLNTYDYLHQQQDPQLVNLFDDVFHKPVQNPNVPRSLTAFKTIFDFPPLPASWKNPHRRPGRMSQLEKDLLECYDRDPSKNFQLFDDWEGRYYPNRNRRDLRRVLSDLKKVGPSAQRPKKVLSNVGKLAGADAPDFDPPIEPPFKPVKRRRKQPEESNQKIQEDQRREIYDSIRSIESMICDIKQKLYFSE